MRRLRTLVTYLPPESVTLLLQRAEEGGSSRTSGRATPTPEAIGAFAARLGGEVVMD